METWASQQIIGFPTVPFLPQKKDSICHHSHREHSQKYQNIYLNYRLLWFCFMLFSLVPFIYHLFAGHSVAVNVWHGSKWPVSQTLTISSKLQSWYCYCLCSYPRRKQEWVDLLCLLGHPCPDFYFQGTPPKLKGVGDPVKIKQELWWTLSRQEIKKYDCRWSCLALGTKRTTGLNTIKDGYNKKNLISTVKYDGVFYRAGNLVRAHGIWNAMKYQNLLNENQPASGRTLKLCHYWIF